MEKNKTVLYNESILDNRNILENFILKFGFVFDRTKFSYNNKISINEIKTSDDVSLIKGAITMNMNNGIIEVISFSTLLTQSDSRLKFESEYQIINFGGNQKHNYVTDGVYIAATQSDKVKAEDTFMILNQVQGTVLNPKSKFLVHMSNGIIEQVYLVSSKYTFLKNGISDGFTLLSMSDRQIADSVNLACGIKNRRG